MINTINYKSENVIAPVPTIPTNYANQLYKNGKFKRDPGVELAMNKFNNLMPDLNLYSAIDNYKFPKDSDTFLESKKIKSLDLTDKNIFTLYQNMGPVNTEKVSPEQLNRIQGSNSTTLNLSNFTKYNPPVYNSFDVVKKIEQVNIKYNDLSAEDTYLMNFNPL
jgi:hypothetical protein